MKIGDLVRNKESGVLGRVAYSTFGVSINSVDPAHHWHTLGGPIEEMALYWEVVKK